MVYWDAHVCPTMEVGCDLDWLHRYRQLGYRFVSLNVGFDPQHRPVILDLLKYFNEYAQQYSKEFRIVQTSDDIDQAIQNDQLALGFDLEGVQLFVDSVEAIADLKRMGVRQVALTYNQNNDLAGGCQDNDAGLSAVGLRWLKQLNQQGIVVDCSHVGKR